MFLAARINHANSRPRCFRCLLVLSFFIIFFIASGISQVTLSASQLKEQVDSLLHQQQGSFAVAFKDLTTGQTLLVNEHEIFHAASTMKTPVLIEIFKQAASGKFEMSDSVTLKNQFRSIVDSSEFSLNPDDDSELELYKHLGEKRSIKDLAYLMITMSSNLATNLLVELVHPENVSGTMRGMGIKDLKVLRGVEDSKAFAKGLNNVVTASDLMLIFEKLANGKAVNPIASEAMIRMLMDQHFKSIIPAGLPAGILVAHKTGWFKGVNHDSGIVYLPGGHNYVLVLLSKDATDDNASVKALSTISRMIYSYAMTVNR